MQKPKYLPYLRAVQLLSHRGIHFATTNQNLSELSERKKVSLMEGIQSYSNSFSAIEWKTDLKNLIGEAVLVKLSSSLLQSIFIQIECNEFAFKDGVGIYSDLWRQFISHLIEVRSAKKYHIILCLDRSTIFSTALWDEIAKLKEDIFPLQLHLELENRSWKNPRSRVLSKTNGGTRAFERWRGRRRKACSSIITSPRPM